jgi:hypothetical protein
MSDKRIRYVIDEGTPFAVHGEGLTIQAHTRKSDVAVTVEIEGVTRKLLLQFQDAIEQELTRREVYWKNQRERLVRKAPEVPADETPVAGNEEVVNEEVTPVEVHRAEAA